MIVHRSLHLCEASNTLRTSINSSPPFVFPKMNMSVLTNHNFLSKSNQLKKFRISVSKSTHIVSANLTKTTTNFDIIYFGINHSTGSKRT